MKNQLIKKFSYGSKIITGQEKLLPSAHIMVFFFSYDYEDSTISVDSIVHNNYRQIHTKRERYSKTGRKKYFKMKKSERETMCCSVLINTICCAADY